MVGRQIKAEIARVDNKKYHKLTVGGRNINKKKTRKKRNYDKKKENFSVSFWFILP